MQIKLLKINVYTDRAIYRLIQTIQCNIIFINLDNQLNYSRF
jgi:hypothetical protein